MDHKAEAIVITCIDYRFQEYIHKWLEENFHPKTYDRGAFAGAAKSLDTILSQIEVASRLHHIKKAIVINHEDCGAYKRSLKGNFQDELSRFPYGAEDTVDHHVRDLRQVKKHILEKFPNLKVETYYLHLDGTFEFIP